MQWKRVITKGQGDRDIVSLTGHERGVPTSVQPNNKGKAIVPIYTHTLCEPYLHYLAIKRRPQSGGCSHSIHTISVEGGMTISCNSLAQATAGFKRVSPVGRRLGVQYN